MYYLPLKLTSKPVIISERLQYPHRTKVHRHAAIALSSESSLLEAEVFGNEYQATIRLLPEEDMPPCQSCPCVTVYFCYLTEIECRTYAVWVDDIR